MTIERNDLSLDAVKINGSYIEDTVTGYQTIKAIGRETLKRELTTVDLLRDGLGFKSARYPAREIEVTFYVQRNSLADMHASMSGLMSALDVDEAEIVFNGEAEFFYKGTPVMDTNITETKNGLIGTFIIQCLDPFKYSVAEYEEEAENKQFSITYAGTCSTYPKLIAEFPATRDANGNNTDTSECGFVGYTDQKGHILQFGDPNEMDIGEIVQPATVPVNKAFTSVSDWTVNESAVITGTQMGTISVGSDHAYPGGYEEGTGYHGPSLSKVITGEGANISKNYNFSWKQKFAATKKQFGCATVILWNNSGSTRTLVSAVHISKKTKDTKCKVEFYVGDTTAKGSITIACNKIGACSMGKIDDKVTFKIGGKTKDYADSRITNLIANEITIFFGQNGTKTELGSNYIYSCKLQRHAFSSEGDIENTFSPGDVLTVKTQDATVFLDEGSATVPAVYLGKLGNDWEDFVLVPGQNVITVDYSDFTKTPPVFKCRYRERYL